MQISVTESKVYDAMIKNNNKITQDTKQDEVIQTDDRVVFFILKLCDYAVCVGQLVSFLTANFCSATLTLLCV